jgi:FlaA1/EpsC-like NDP-sugar epimerase
VRGGDVPQLRGEAVGCREGERLAEALIAARSSAALVLEMAEDADDPQAPMRSSRAASAKATA